MLISVSMVGFIVFDVAYTSVVINYAIQCQLMIYYMYSICTRINNKEWDTDQAIKVQTTSVTVIIHNVLHCRKFIMLANF